MAEQATNQAELATKKGVLVDVKIVIEPPYFGMSVNAEGHARSLERWARELEDFILDHRSQDPVKINIERVFQPQCSGCGAEWEEEFYEDDGLWHCSGCGRIIEVER